MELKLFNTSPHAKDYFWQFVLLPTITMLRNNDPDKPYTVCSVEWLFWSLTLVINDFKRSKAKGIC